MGREGLGDGQKWEETREGKKQKWGRENRPSDFVVGG